MTFVISYRDPREPTIARVRIVSGESEVEETLGRLEHEGHEVVRITPPPIGLILEGKVSLPGN